MRDAHIAARWRDKLRPRRSRVPVLLTLALVALVAALVIGQ